MHLARHKNFPLSSFQIRKTFLDFFCNENGHKLIRSSPVVPHNDPSLAFVNAGMNQFKGVFLGTTLPPAKRVANSQKCVRVGGKHNDLDQVGSDGTHHTFFEMLGNWSFGDYYKKEACQMSWELLTSVYGLDPRQLHITYFAGDKTMGLLPDYETRDIWLQLGVPPDRIEPKGVSDNFWEMGETGPCGMCTEIHHLPTMLELWNLVFIEFRRESDGHLEKLKCHHVDTGMGFERLVSVLQGKSSNYDTDLFLPIFAEITKATNCQQYSSSYNSLDTAYRILADHARMFTVCLADGFLPDQEGKLRGIIRRSLTIARENFNQEEELLKKLSTVVAENLGTFYPELSQNLHKIKHVLDHEAELLRNLRGERLNEWHVICSREPQLTELSVSECPNLIPAYQRLKTMIKSSDTVLTPAVALKLCETFGVPSHLIGQLAKALKLDFDFSALEMEITKAKMESRKNFEMDLPKNELIVDELRKCGVAETDDSSKYSYLNCFEDVLRFPEQSANIVGFIVDGDLVDFASADLLAVPDLKIGLILDRTNVYCESGGQASDTGTIIFNNEMALKIDSVCNSAGYIVHYVTPISLSSAGLRVNQQCLIKIDENRRKSLMNNHTATHLLNAALQSVLTIVQQKSSKVTAEKLTFDFSVYRQSLTIEDLKRIEGNVCRVIGYGANVRRRSVANPELPLIDYLTVLPGETYHHEKIHIIEINCGYFLSREPCCGTHALNTKNLEDFVIIGFKSLSSCVKSIRAVTGTNAAIARTNHGKFLKQLFALKNEGGKILNLVPVHQNMVEMFDEKLVRFLNQVKETELLGFIAEDEILTEISNLRALLKNSARGVLRMSIEMEMKQVLAKHSGKFLVHYLQCSSGLDTVPLQKAARLCPDIASILFATDGELIKARCCVPKQQVNESFSAEIWMKCVLNELKATGSAPRGQNPQLVFNMKGKKIKAEKLEIAIRKAKEFVEEK